jgi:hypothetical protein
MGSSTSTTIASDRESAARVYSEKHYDEALPRLSGHHENGLFFNCQFDDIRGLTLKDCVLTRSEFVTDTVAKAIGFTMSVGDCNTFADVKYSELLFDLLLCQMIKTKGNTEKRRKLVELLGRDRVHQLLSELERLNRGEL